MSALLMKQCVSEKMKKENMKKSMMSSETMDLPMSKTI